MQFAKNVHASGPKNSTDNVNSQKIDKYWLNLTRPFYFSLLSSRRFLKSSQKEKFKTFVVIRVKSWNRHIFIFHVSTKFGIDWKISTYIFSSCMKKFTFFSNRPIPRSTNSASLQENYKFVLNSETCLLFFPFGLNFCKNQSVREFRKFRVIRV